MTGAFLVWFPHNGPQGSSTPTKDMDFCGAIQSLHSHINTRFCRCSWKDVIIVILSLRGGDKFAHSIGLWVYESWILFLRLPDSANQPACLCLSVYKHSILSRDLLGTLLQGVSLRKYVTFPKVWVPVWMCRIQPKSENSRFHVEWPLLSAIPPDHFLI